MKSKQFYTSAAWKAFRGYILLLHGEYSNGEWFVKCATSGKLLKFPDKNTHVGHYIKLYDGWKPNFATAFDEANVMPQHGGRNKNQGGQQDLMAIAIESKWGRGAVNGLNIKRYNKAKLGPLEMNVYKQIYEKKYLKLANTKGDPFEWISRLEKKYKKTKR